MGMDLLHDLLLAAPSEGVEQSALAVLKSLALEGDTAATNILLRALAHVLGFHEAVEILAIADPGKPPPYAVLPAPLAAYAAALVPREFIGMTGHLSTMPAWKDDKVLQSFRLLVLSRHLMQQEALKAIALAVFAEVVSMNVQADIVRPERMFSILEHVWNEACVVEGAEVDDSLHCGREKLLGLHSMHALFQIIAHELGHQLLDLVWGIRDSGEFPVSISSDQEAALCQFASILPELVKAGCELHGQPFSLHDRRRYHTQTGVSVLCSHESRPEGDYFHLSFSFEQGPVSLEAGVLYGCFVMFFFGFDLRQVAFAWSPKGIFHAGFRGACDDFKQGAPAGTDAAAIASDLVARTPELVDMLLREKRIGGSVQDIPIALGIGRRERIVYGTNLERAFDDIRLIRRLSAVSAEPPEEPLDATKLLAASWRAAVPEVLNALLGSFPQLRAALPGFGWPLDEVGSSLLAIRDETGTLTLYAPTRDALTGLLSGIHEAGVSLESPADSHGHTLLIRAVVRNEALVSHLLELGVDPDGRDAEGYTPMLWCAMIGNVAVAAMLVARGASLRQTGPEEFGMLHFAVAAGHEHLVEWLLANGAVSDVQDNRGRTPLMHARSEKVVRWLCDAGASVHTATHEGECALHVAAGEGRLEVVRLLLEHGADPGASTVQGFTPLHYAAVRQDGAGCMRALIDAGADVNDETGDGETPLHFAVRSGSVEAVGLLLDSGADPEIADMKGHTPHSLAGDSGRSAITELFEKAIRKREDT